MFNFYCMRDTGLRYMPSTTGFKNHGNRIDRSSIPHLVEESGGAQVRADRSHARSTESGYQIRHDVG
jgi:hypothetical protein